MSTYKQIIIGIFISVSCLLKVSSQENRTLETKVADILAQLPTDHLAQSDKLMQDIISMGEIGILKFTDLLVPLGTGNDTKARYALHSLAVYSGKNNVKNNNATVESSLLTALNNASNNEVKSFLMTRLLYCGTDKSIPELKAYLADNELYQPALATLTAIGTSASSEAILSTAATVQEDKKVAFVSALGSLKYAPATSLLKTFVQTNTPEIEEKVLAALANIGAPGASETLIQAAKKSNFRLDDSKAILSLISYANTLSENNNKQQSNEIVDLLLRHCVADDQLHFRSAAIYLLRKNKGEDATKTLLKEALHPNKIYSASVIAAASKNLTTLEVDKWVKNYRKASNTVKPLLITMLANRKEAAVFSKVIAPAITNTDEALRVAALKALAHQDNNKAFPLLLKTIKTASTAEDLFAIKESLLKLVSEKEVLELSNNLKNTKSEGQSVLIEILAARNATSEFSKIIPLLNGANSSLRTTIYKALPDITTYENLSVVLGFLEKENDEQNSINAQKAIIKMFSADEVQDGKAIYDAFSSFENPSKLMPILATLSTEKALEFVTNQLHSTNENEQLLALDALANWKNNDAVALLFSTVTDFQNQQLSEKAFGSYLDKVIQSTYPDDQKLLLVDKLVQYSTTTTQKGKLIKAASKIKTFLSLLFVADFLEDEQLVKVASNAIIQIALPTPGVNDGLSGAIVRAIVSKSIANLDGPDSQYIKIDVQEFLDKMPNEEGFVAIFNGKDFSGWEGLVKNPIARNAMSAPTLAKEQEKANQQMLKDWYIKNGVIGFKGEGYNNICTIKDYADFEMLVDWKITKGGDSGIYLRGTPQVQIWDIALVKVGAEVGSGGLYNNQKNESKPLVVADNPINEWNTFRIKMIGDRVTVHLNGVLVTDDVVLENYWDRNSAIFIKEAIELQAHGEDLGFRNIYVKEIFSMGDDLTSEEVNQGFVSLFNGENLEHWMGNKTDYLVEKGELAVKPKQGGHGNLYTQKEYSDFIFRFDFKLTSGANNGLGIHAPLEGDAAYEGKELQILDNTAAIYKNLEAYQYHGSVYGIIPAKKGFLNPVGEWNTQEVVVRGDDIKITLNGTVILEGNLKKAVENGIIDGKSHPGLNKKSGHIGFLGHGSELWFRNIRIKDLAE